MASHPERENPPEDLLRLVDAQKKDLCCVLEMIREFYRHFGMAYEQESKRSALERFLSDHSLGALWVIERNGGAIGYVLVAYSWGLEFDGRVAFIDELFVQSAARSCGAGEWAIREVTRRCKSVGVRALRLECERTNERAADLYRRLGFVDHARHLVTIDLSKDSM